MKKYKLFLIMFLIVPYIEIANYAIGDKLVRILDIWKILSVGIIMFIYFYKKKSISKIMLYMICFQGIFVVATMLNSESRNLRQQIIQGISVISICMLAEIYVKKDGIILLKAMSIVLGVLSFIHIYTMFRYYPQGMYLDDLGNNAYYFLGYDNTSFFNIFPFVVYFTAYIYYKKGKNGLLTYLVVAFVTVAYLYVKSTTSAIMMLLFIMFLLINDLKIFPKIFNRIFNIRNIIIVVLCIFLFVVVFQGQQYFTELLREKFNKGSTLSGRTNIWKQATNYIKESPVIGYGLESANKIVSKFNINHVHNIILDILYKGGSIALMFYILVVNCARKPLMIYKETFLAKLITMGLFIYWFAGIFDYYNNKYIIFTFFILATYVSEFKGTNLIKEKKVCK